MRLEARKLALLSAALFGVSVPLAKPLLGWIDPLLLAGLLYLGAFLGLAAVQGIGGHWPLSGLAALPLRQRRRFSAAVLCGGVLAPAFLLCGLKRSSALEASLLLNLEAPATAMLARIFFHERLGARLWGGHALIIVGGIMLSGVSVASAFTGGGILVAAACVLWALDNNLTRDVEACSPVTLAAAKGLMAGSANAVLGIMGGAALPRTGTSIGAVILGAFSYGASLALFIAALRRLGSARASAYFATAPVFGAALAIALGERPGPSQIAAAALMACGAWIVFGERHLHAHVHEPLSHSHWHDHDEHHPHGHAGPHEEQHVHEPLSHSHAHWPDSHHRH